MTLRSFHRSFLLLALAISSPVAGQEESAESQAILPLFDYSGNVGSRGYLSGDWNGARTAWAERGLTFDFQWTQFAHGVVSGGIDEGWEFPGSLDSVIRYDGLRAEVWPALFTLRVESRYGENVNDDTGTLLPANLDVAMPITDPADDDILATITELNVVQPLSGAWALVLGKVQTLDSDPSEFASGRGRDQFFQFPMVANAVTALTVPYSTLAAGAVWTNGVGMNVSSLVMNTADSSTTTGFDDFGEGVTWATELQSQYNFWYFPGGQNLGLLYAFDGDYRRLGGKLQVTPSGVTAERESTSWAAYWTGWQYLVIDANAKEPDSIQAGDAHPDLEGLGVFARLGIADEDTNPIEWAGSVGLGGRGPIDGRPDDCWGLGVFTNALEEPETTVIGALEDRSGGVEAFYSVPVAPSAVLTADVQWLESAFDGVDDALLIGLRLNLTL